LDQQATREARNLIFNTERPFAAVDRQVNNLPDNQTINQLFAGTPELFRGVSGLQITPSETLDRLGVFTPQIQNTFPQQAIGLFPVPPSTTTAPITNNSPFSSGSSFGAATPSFGSLTGVGNSIGGLSGFGGSSGLSGLDNLPSIGSQLSQAFGSGLSSNNNSILTGTGAAGLGSFFNPSGNEAFAPNLGIQNGQGIPGSAILRLLLSII
jgi:hypothetical protein